MSELSVKVAQEHVLSSREGSDKSGWRQPTRWFTVYCCSCGWESLSLNDYSAHLARVTEAAVRETIAADIEQEKRDWMATVYRTALDTAAVIARTGTVAKPYPPIAKGES